MGMTVQVEKRQQKLTPHWAKRGFELWNRIALGAKVVIESSPVSSSCLPSYIACFASTKAYQNFYEQIWFSQIRSLRYDSAWTSFFDEMSVNEAETLIPQWA